MAGKKLNILFVKPFIVADEIQPPLGLGYLATTVRDKHNVEIVDGIKDRISLDDFRKMVEAEKYDVIGIQCYTLDKEIVRDMIGVAREANPKVVTIVGGPQPSAETESVHGFMDSDFGFMGEAEIGFPMLVSKVAGKAVELKDIPSLIWKDGGKVIVNSQKFIQDLDDLKHPSWDILKPDKYPLAPHGAFFKRHPTAPIFTTRGCPFQCTFCAGFTVSGRKIRYRSVKNIVDEIEMLHKTYGINEVHIEDDNFTMKRQFVVDFCNEILKRKLDITWACPNGVRLDTLDEELIALMQKSGLYVVSVGIESGSERILKDMKKSLTKKTIKEKIELIDRMGLDVVGFFILGYPGETVETINETIDFACELPLKRVSFMTFKPFPGTEITKRIMEEMDTDEIKWENFALNRVAYAPKGMTVKQLKQLRQKALMKFYFRPKIAYHFFKGLKSFEHSKYVFERAFRWLVK